MDFAKNQLLDGEIIGYNSEGQGVARINGRAVFVSNAARGDVATLRVVKATNAAVYAKIETLHTPSPHRQPPNCPVSAECGGCVYQHIDYNEEFLAKKQQVVDALTRLGHCETLPDIDVYPAPNCTHYRNKALYPIGDGPCYGFYKERSHEVVALSQCAIQDPRADAAAHAVLNWMTAYHIKPYDATNHRGLVRHVFARTGDNGCLLALVANGPPSRTKTLVEALRTACPDAVGIVWVENEKRDNVVLQGKTKLLWGVDTLTETLCGMTFQINLHAFFQVNKAQAERLYTVAVDYADCNPQTTAVDLYCGTGTITLCLARTGAQSIGIESVAAAVDDATANATRNNLPTRFLCADAADGLAQLKEEGVTPDVLVVDPPRKGLSPALIPLLGEQTQARLVYISCNPATLARDINLLRPYGYELHKLAVVDLFPRTKHVECVALLTRVNG